MAERMQGWTPPAPRYTWGVFAKYAALVSSADLRFGLQFRLTGYCATPEDVEDVMALRVGVEVNEGREELELRLNRLLPAPA